MLYTTNYMFPARGISERAPGTTGLYHDGTHSGDAFANLKEAGYIGVPLYPREAQRGDRSWQHRAAVGALCYVLLLCTTQTRYMQSR